MYISIISLCTESKENQHIISYACYPATMFVDL